jgi:ribonuclease G
VGKVRKQALKKLIVNYVTREKRFALIADQRVERLVVNQPKHISSVGNIYVGTVTKVLPGMNAAFVEIGEEKNGFIHRDKLDSFVLSNEGKDIKEKKSISTFVHQGERLLVQVEKDSTGTKGSRLTGVIELSGNHLIYMPRGKYIAISKKIDQPEIREKWRLFGYQLKQEEEGVIFRTSCENASEQAIQVELNELRNQYYELKVKAKAAKKPMKIYEQDHFLAEMVAEIKPIVNQVEVIVDDIRLMEKLRNLYPSLPISLYTGKENIFSVYKLEGEIEKALKRVVWLENGAYIVIDEVEALTIMDVNTGKFSGKNDLADTVLKTNILAAIEAARQFRLRDIGGMILIDFIDMKTDEERNKVINAIMKEIKKDGRRTMIIGFTPLGILQLTRKKTKVSISEAFTVKCPVCEGTGRILSPETVAFRLERELYEYGNRDIDEVVIELSEEVKSVFSGDQDIHKYRLEEILGFSLNFDIQQNEKPFYHIRYLH